MTKDKVKKASKFLLWYHYPERFFEDVFGYPPFPYQKEVLYAVKKGSKRIVIQAAGGTGKTLLLAGIALYLAIVVSKVEGEPIKVVIISGSRDQAKYLYDYCMDALEHEYLEDEIEGEPLQSITRFKNGSEIRALPNSLKAIQGKHADVVIIDEAVLAGDFLIRDAFRITAGRKRDIIILSGTPMDAASLFCNIFQDQDEYPEWIRFHWSAKECPLITEEKLEEIKNLPDDVRTIFWEGKPFTSKVERVVDFESLKRACKNVPRFNVDPKGEKVVIGVDWGWQHYTAIVVLQKVEDEFRVLYCDQWRREEFESIHDKIEQIYKQYGASIIYADAEDVGENQRLEARGLVVKPIPFQRKKTQMQTMMRMIFYQGKIKIPQEFQDLIQQLRNYSWDTKKNDDLVDALMLALYNYEEEKEESIWWLII